MDWRSLVIFVWLAVTIAGIVLALNGLVQLAVRNKIGRWKDGGASLLTGVIVAGVLIAVMVLWLGQRLIPPPC
jgi:hypothetical protein